MIFNAEKPVVAAGSRVLLGPHSCMEEEHVARANRLGAISRLEHASLAMLADAVEVGIRVDGVLFAGGDMFGTDGPSWAPEIEARATAARRVALDVRHLFESGDDRARVVTRLTEAAKERLGEEGSWYRTYLERLGHKASKDPNSFEDQLRGLERMGRARAIVLKNRKPN